jgi:hypothetical protein
MRVVHAHTGRAARARLETAGNLPGPAAEGQGEMASEYDPFLAPARARFESSNLELARGLFAEASSPYLSSPLPWAAWAVILPVTALATPLAAGRFDWAGVLLLWSFAILLGGAFELTAIRRTAAVPGTARETVSTPLASWAFGVQGNLSLVAISLSFLLLWVDQAWALPGLWLLLLGHSFVTLGGLSFPPLRQAGLIYQIGGVAALWPRGAPLLVLAVTTCAANLWMALALRRRQRTQPAPATPLP